METDDEGTLVLAYEPKAFLETLEKSFYPEPSYRLTDDLNDKEAGDLFMFILTDEGAGGSVPIATS